MRIMFPLALAACTSGSPLSQVTPQVEIQVDPEANLAVSLTTWNDLAILRDAMDAGQIVTTLDGEPVPVDPVTTGTYGGGNSFVAAFVRPSGRHGVTPPGPATSSTIAISDGTVTWSARVADLFTNDLAPTGPLAAGEVVFEWPSAASETPYSTIAWACVEVTGSSAACGGTEVAEPAITIAKQYITATIEGDPGAAVVVTGERHINPESDGNGPVFFTRIQARFAGTL